MLGFSELNTFILIFRFEQSRLPIIIHIQHIYSKHEKKNLKLLGLGLRPDSTAEESNLNLNL